jgi:hypothetical protein
MRLRFALRLVAAAAGCAAGAATADWLVHPPATPAAVEDEGCTLRLTNGLLTRTFAVPRAGRSSRGAHQ